MSLAAAPTPVASPYQRPLFSVRCTQSMPTGPIGALAIIPIRIPLKMKSNIFIGICIGISGAKVQIKNETHKKMSPVFSTIKKYRCLFSLLFYYFIVVPGLGVKYHLLDVISAFAAHLPNLSYASVIRVCSVGYAKSPGIIIP